MSGQGNNGMRYGATGGGYDRRHAAPRHRATQRPASSDRGSVQPPRAYDPRANASAYNSPQRYANARHDRGRRTRRRGSAAPALIALFAIVLIAGVGVYLFLNPLSYGVTINGETHTVDRGTTISGVIEKGLATPQAGNLLAVDGSVITAGGGDAFAATVNGTPTTDGTTVLAKDAVVEISDGADVTESYTSTEETIAHGQRESNTSREGYWTGSLHVYEKGQDGVRSVKTGDISGITIAEDVTPAIDSGYVIYTADVGDDKVVALTFDDGPWDETTDEILDILEANGAKATFFTIGNQIAGYASQVKRAHDMGCQVCTHTWDHADGAGQGVNLTYMSADQQIAEVQKGYQAIAEIIGEEPSHILRAPGGNYYGSIVSTLEPYVDAEIGWDVDTEDWRRPGSDAILEMIMSVRPGQVVLMHDGGGPRAQTVEAVRQAVPALVEQGYRLVTIDDLLAYGLPADV